MLRMNRSSFSKMSAGFAIFLMFLVERIYAHIWTQNWFLSHHIFWSFHIFWPPQKATLVFWDARGTRKEFILYLNHNSTYLQSEREYNRSFHTSILICHLHFFFLQRFDTRILHKEGAYLPALHCSMKFITLCWKEYMLTIQVTKPVTSPACEVRSKYNLHPFHFRITKYPVKFVISFIIITYTACLYVQYEMF